MFQVKRSGKGNFGFSCVDCGKIRVDVIFTICICWARAFCASYSWISILDTDWGI